LARGLQVGDGVYIPRAKLGLAADGPSAFWRTTVRQIVGRSIIVDLPGRGNPLSEPVAASAAHKNVGVVIVRIGDYATEATLLDPLAKSLLQFCRLLLPDDMLLLREVRSLRELRRFWSTDHPAHSHLVLIGHGREDGIRFGQDWQSPGELAAALRPVGNVGPKVVISLCCKNGHATFAQRLSEETVCPFVIAPFDMVHGAVASQFCQTFLAHHLLRGATLKVAFRHARNGVPGATNLRLWTRGVLAKT
jgi:hypothetical protein